MLPQAAASLAYPRLRPLDGKWLSHQGQRMLRLRDPLGLTQGDLLVPQHIALFMGLCDGRRDLDTLRAAYMLRAGEPIGPAEAAQLVAELDEALLLDSPRFAAACQGALARYRQSPYRNPALADGVYPADPEALERSFAEFCAAAPPPAPAGVGPVLGVLSPHIDYHRGNRVYARLWQQVAPDLADVELVVILGTDHAGGAGKITLTRQSYATPWGPLPNDPGLVETLLARLGEEPALEEEIHHLNEHSVELAAVWLHHALRKAAGGRNPARLPRVLPVLCGHMAHFVRGEAKPEADHTFAAFLETLRPALAQRRTLVVAAGDLAHVGPAFGDSEPLGADDRASLRAADEISLEAIGQGDARAFFLGAQAEQDERRICGLAPIYLALRLLDGPVFGQVTGYDQCPADAAGGSLVSIAGVVWRQG